MRKTKEISGDHLTAVTAFLRLRGKGKSLLESIPREKSKGRYSIIGINPVHEITCYQNRLKIDGKEQEVADPLQVISDFVLKSVSGEEPLPFEAGAIGYVGYDVFALYEELGELPPDPLNVPDIHFYLYESFLLFDHGREKITLVQDNCYSNRSETSLLAGLERMEQDLMTSQLVETAPVVPLSLDFKSNCTQGEYEQMVKTGQSHITLGDVFQVVPSQRLSADFNGDSFAYYRQLRLSNPSAYLYYLDFGKTKVIGSSPESLISLKDGVVLTNPIAGTRKRGATLAEDQQLAMELLNDPKEVAEHQMLVDLGRNDLSKISETGSVSVPLYLVVEKYRFVMHLVSVVSGRIKKGLSGMDALKATLPAGTVSGAPKIRACQLIYQLEPVKRGIYGGAVGYLTKNDQMDFAIAIRTLVLHEGVAHVQAGAGVVYDSVPEKEYQETLQKAKALLEVAQR